MVNETWSGPCRRRLLGLRVLLICSWVAMAGCHVGDLVQSTDPDSTSTDPPDTSAADPDVQATHLVFEVHPADVVAGDPIRPSVRVVARDDDGKAVTDFAGTVTIAIASGPGDASLSGDLGVQAVDGVAVFDDLSIDQAAADYTLSATASELDDAVSDPFAVAPGTPDAVELVEGNGQTDSVAATLSDPYVIRVVDSHGNPVPAASVAWTVARGGGSVTNDDSATDAWGKASAIHTFGALAGDQVVVAAAVGLSGATVTFVSHARAGQPFALDFARQPTNTPSGVTIAPPVVAEILDQFGNVVTQAQRPVAVDIAPFTGTPLATLSGTLTRSPVNGTVTFDDLSIDLPGVGYRLRLTSEGLSQDSRAFHVY